MLVISICAVFLILGSYFDLKTGEIPDEVSLGLVAFGILFAVGDSLYSGIPAFFVTSLLMMAGYFLVGYLLFYLGQWGGGDVKLLAGIGAVLGYLASKGFLAEGLFPYYIIFFINMGFVTWPYAILYSITLTLGKPESLRRFRSYVIKPVSILTLIFSLIPSIFAFSIGMELLGWIYLILPFFVLGNFYLKAIEEVALQKTVKTEELREGDLLAEDLILDGKVIGKRRDMEGLSKEQISKIRKLALNGKIPPKIGIRWGIRFAPILFLSFISLVFLGDLLEIVLRLL